MFWLKCVTSTYLNICTGFFHGFFIWFSPQLLKYQISISEQFLFKKLDCSIVDSYNMSLLEYWGKQTIFEIASGLGTPLQLTMQHKTGDLGSLLEC